MRQPGVRETYIMLSYFTIEPLFNIIYTLNHKSILYQRLKIPHVRNEK